MKKHWNWLTVKFIFSLLLSVLFRWNVTLKKKFTSHQIVTFPRKTRFESKESTVLFLLIQLSVFCLSLTMCVSMSLHAIFVGFCR